MILLISYGSKNHHIRIWNAVFLCQTSSDDHSGISSFLSILGRFSTMIKLLTLDNIFAVGQVGTALVNWHYCRKLYTSRSLDGHGTFPVTYLLVGHLLGC